MTEPVVAWTTDPERSGRSGRLAGFGLLAIVGLSVFVFFVFGPGGRQPLAEEPSTSAPALPTASQPGSSALSPSVAVSPTVGVASPAQSPFTPLIEVEFSHGAPGTLQFVTGLAQAEGRRVAAINVQGSERISPTGPWGGDGAIYVEQADGTWTHAETGGSFESIRISYLFAPHDGPFVIYGSVGYSPTPRDVTGVWTSNDGMTWTEVAVEPHDGVIAEGPLGYLQALVARDESGSATLQIYTSADALAWQLAYSIDVPSGAFVWAAGVGPEGYVVTYDEAGDDTRSRVLASADGSTWHPAPDQPSFASDDIVMAISDLGSDWVAAGWVRLDDGAIALWWSADGLNWERVGTLTADIESFGVPADLFELDGRLFLNVSLAMEGSETRPAAVFTSLDGQNWEMLGVGPEAEVRTGLTTDCCLLLGGRIGIEGAEAVIWRVER